ncbi:MAG: cytochrome c-type biogenesis protein [Pseudomonadota bacterium]
MIRALAVALVVAFAAGPAAALTAAEQLDDPVLEERAREIGKLLRCPVCQNESIDESRATVAQDLRRVVRERLLAGDEDAEVIAFIHARYGDFVLLKPPLKPETYLLWGAPALALLIALLAAWSAFRRRSDGAPETAPLTPEEEARAAALLAEAEAPRRD